MNTLKDQLFRRLVPQQQLLVQLPGDIIDRLSSTVDPLRDGQTDLIDQPLHVHLLERTADDDVREERGGREGDHETG